MYSVHSLENRRRIADLPGRIPNHAAISAGSCNFEPLNILKIRSRLKGQCLEILNIYFLFKRLYIWATYEKAKLGFANFFVFVTIFVSLTWKSDAISILRSEAKFNSLQDIYEHTVLTCWKVYSCYCSIDFNFWFFFLVQEKYLSADKTLQNAKPADVVYER